MRFGSFTNMVTTNGVIGMPEPVVGMGCTLCFWTDREAATVVEVVRNKAGKLKKVTVQVDKAIRCDKNGMSESQNYLFEINPNGSKKTFTMRKNGRWAEQGYGMNGGTGISFGHRDAYHDYSF